MNRSAEPIAPRPPSGAESLHKPTFIIFLVLWAVNGALVLLKIEPPRDAAWPEALLALSATATLLVGLNRRLPLQNVVLSTLMIAAFSGLLAAVNAKTGIPYGPRVFQDAAGWQILEGVPWSLLCLWIVAIVSSRGVARLIVRPWRKTKAYGFWVIGLTNLLALIFDFGLEPHAGAARRYWTWHVRSSVPEWYGAPWVNFLGWAVTLLGILFLTTPWLINKQPVKQPTDYHPLLVWLLLNVYLATSNWVHGCEAAAVLGVTAGFVAAVFAIRGGRW